MITAKDITKTFVNGTLKTPVLKGIDLHIPSGEFVSIIGPSGSGKSTFLYQVGLLDHPTTGTIEIDGRETTTMSSRQRTKFRLDMFGFVFQDYAILPELTALENVMMPSLMAGKSFRAARREAADMLEAIGMADKLHNTPSKLSGGQQQRVSIARAAAAKPSILFADEPTANLDSINSKEVVEVFKQLNDMGQTIVMVTHESDLAQMSDRVVELYDGVIRSDKKGKK